jgi:ribose transport system permease protein
VKRLFSEYGSVLILLLLCGYYSVVTWGEQHPQNPAAGRRLARTIIDQAGPQATVLIVVRGTGADREFARAIEQRLQDGGARVLAVAAGQPGEARQLLARLGAEHPRIDAIATNHAGSQWRFLQPAGLADIARESPGLRETRVFRPASYKWPGFLTRANLVNVINQNADIAILAIGMTMVIITAGIDLSVGSLVAFCGVITAIAIQSLAGGADASVIGLLACSLLSVLAGAALGTFSGVMVTAMRIPAFVVTLAMMEIARGMALKTAVAYRSAAGGGAIAGTPEAISIQAPAFQWLGNGQLLGVPNPIVLMILLYVIAHFVMSRTAFGRYLYAVGGNPEAARLSGVPVLGVLIAVYAICGAMAGLAGIVDASRFMGGRPSAGVLYELRVIAAVVVGGTSLAGGEGRVFGTLIGALIIAVIQNGLNMAGVQSFDQMIVFGLLILAAVLLDQLKKRSWFTRRTE